MRDFAFAEARPQLVPAHKRSTFAMAVVIHVLVVAALVLIKTPPVRVSPQGDTQGGIGAYIMVEPVGAAPAAAPKRREPKMAMKTEPAREAAQPDAGAGGATGVVDQAGAGPVRLGAGGNIALLKKVQPVYPPMMQSARITGQVVLDAIIHADGTIGDVTVLQATNPTFARAAMDAVKQWKYQPIGFEAILTVTVNFTLT